MGPIAPPFAGRTNQYGQCLTVLTRTGHHPRGASPELDEGKCSMAAQNRHLFAPRTQLGHDQNEFPARTLGLEALEHLVAEPQTCL
jgi:hypothetical protein